MAVSVKPVVLWRSEIENRPGSLAGLLGHLSAVDLDVVMGYRYPGSESKAAVEVCPISSKKVAAAAQAAGLSPSSIPALRVEGDNRRGLGHAITKSIADAGINLNFLVAQVIGRKHSTILGFDTEADARKAVPLIRKAAGRKK